MSLLVRLLNAVAFLPQVVVLVMVEVVPEIPVLFPVLVVPHPVPLPVDARTVSTRACAC